MANVTTAAGDCFNSIAKAQGFFNYLTIYNFSDNAANFPNPNCLAYGSTVKVPDKQMKAFPVTLDGETKFLIIRKKTKVKVTICKADSAQTPGLTKVTLAVGRKSKTVTVATVEIDDIDPSEQLGSLTVVLANPPAYAPPPAMAAAVLNQYPPAIVIADFDDPKTLWPTKGETINWILEVGYLEPHTQNRGVFQRLANLGFVCSNQKNEDPATKRAVKTYQRFVQNLADPADTGDADDIRAHIKPRHDD